MISIITTLDSSKNDIFSTVSRILEFKTPIKQWTQMLRLRIWANVYFRKGRATAAWDSAKNTEGKNHLYFNPYVEIGSCSHHCFSVTGIVKP